MLLEAKKTEWQKWIKAEINGGNKGRMVEPIYLSIIELIAQIMKIQNYYYIVMCRINGKKI